MSATTMDEDRFKLLVKLMPVASKSGVIDFKLRKTCVERDASPLLPRNNLKPQRIADERQSKIQKLTISTPRDEFTKVLSDQMATAGFNKSLMVNMFHIDFRYNVEAIQWLQDDIAVNAESFICNLDLVLKWLALLLIDSIRPVTFKIFDYVEHILDTLISRGYDCTDGECACFLSCLLSKFGDSDELVRNKVRLFMRQFCSLYNYRKISVCILKGLESKNAQQRAECLAELIFLVDLHGVSAFCPTPAVALRDIAKYISDHQSSVSRAALNLCARACFLFGSDIGGMFGELQRKDQALLDERIRRFEEECTLLIDPSIAPALVNTTQVTQNDSKSF